MDDTTMFSCKEMLQSSEQQLCYVQCGFCTTILLVQVPCTSMWKMVTVRCGYCDGLLSVNMMRANIFPLHLLASLTDEAVNEKSAGDASPNACGGHSPSITGVDGEDEEPSPFTIVVNKPPEKRQRAPSAYNQFIKEEIKRLKAIEPSITHKEAFSTAAKNWSQFPPIEQIGEIKDVDASKRFYDDIKGLEFLDSPNVLHNQEVA